MISVDQAVKMTINRSCKETDSLSAKTENLAVSDRQAEIHHYMEEMREHLYEKVWKNTKNVNIELGA